MAVTISLDQLQTELDSLNTAINTYHATGILPASYSVPTGHSVDVKDTLASLYARRKELIQFINSQDPPYMTSVLG